MSLMTKPRETRGLLRVGSAAVCVVVGLATCGSALALRLEVNEPPPPVTATATAAPRGPVRVASGIAAGAKVGGENPIYPAAARKAHVEGTVALRAIIGKTGAVTNLQVIDGPDLLRRSAMDAVRTWQYKPYLLNGEPTAVETTIHVNYSLGG